jgi:hypothetical protein
LRANGVEQFWGMVKKSDRCWIWTGYTVKDGYGRFRIGGKKRLVHRLSYQWANGAIPAGAEIDHMCSNRACVNPRHLRAVTKFANAQNRASANSNGRSGVRGVYQVRDKWRAVAMLNRVPHQIGYFETIEEAEAAITRWRRENMPDSLIDQRKAT